jgi:HEAT repeat protein
MKSVNGIALVAFLSLILLSACGSSATREAVRKAEALADSRAYDQALELLRKEIRTHPKEFRLHEAYATVVLRMNRIDQAQIVCEEMNRQFPKRHFLVDALKHRDAIVRIGAARLVGLQKDERAIGPLTALLQDPELEVRRAAVTALGEMRVSKSADVLRQALTDKDWAVRADAADALRKVGDHASLPNLICALRDEESYVRCNASRAVQELAQPSDVPDLQRALKNENRTIRITAALALARLKNTDGIPILKECLADADWTIRRDAIGGVVQLQERSLLPDLHKRLADSDRRVRLEAIAAIGRFRDESSLPDLEALLKNEKEPRDIRIASILAAREILREMQRKAAASVATLPPPAGQKTGGASPSTAKPRPSGRK